MGRRHRTHRVGGVLFHPVAVLPARAHDLLANFLTRAVSHERAA
jgi:anthranilate/para-aminobenzoate synthase component II